MAGLFGSQAKAWSDRVTDWRPANESFQRSGGAHWLTTIYSSCRPVKQTTFNYITLIAGIRPKSSCSPPINNQYNMVVVMAVVVMMVAVVMVMVVVVLVVVVVVVMVVVVVVMVWWWWWLWW